MKNILVSGSGLAPLRPPPVPGAGAGGTAGRNPGRAAALAVPHPAVVPGKGLTVQKYTLPVQKRGNMISSSLRKSKILQGKWVGSGTGGNVYV
jgi:hypothetical protein